MMKAMEKRQEARKNQEKLDGIQSRIRARI